MMLSGGNAKLFYPMTADVYYAVSAQDDMGRMVKTWRFDRRIACSAIKERAEYNARNQVQADKFLSYTLNINFRTQENLIRESNGVMHRPTDVLISNILDPSGTPVWEEDADDLTTFEIQSMEPMFDETHTLAGYRALLSRSGNQVENDV